MTLGMFFKVSDTCIANQDEKTVLKWACKWGIVGRLKV